MTNPDLSDKEGLRRARALWAGDKRSEAIALFERVALLHPESIMARVDTARVLASTYQVERAETHLRAARSLGGSSAQALHLIGQSYRLMRRHDSAIDCLQAAVGIDPGLSDAHLELAILLERRGDLEAARAHCEQRLRLSPGDAETRFLLGRLQRRRDNRETAERLLAEVAASPAHGLTRARACAELARLRESDGRYDNAWETMLRGKQLLLPLAPPHRQRRQIMIPALARLSESLTADHLARWREQALAMEVQVPSPVLLTGMPRSGTTLLAQRLGEHSDVLAADEFDIFPRFTLPMLLGSTPPDRLIPAVLDDLPSHRIADIRNTHARLFRSAIPGLASRTILLDKNPSLLPVIAPRARLFADPIVVMLRDPRDILISGLFVHMPLNEFSVDFLRIETAVDRLESDLGGWVSLRKKLPEGSWIEVRYEDLVRNPDSELARVRAFLTLSAAPSAPSGSASAPVYSPSYAEVVEPIHTRAMARWEHYAHCLGPHIERLDALANRMGY